jgi:hypothetical protein
VVWRFCIAPCCALDVEMGVVFETQHAKQVKQAKQGADAIL